MQVIKVSKKDKRKYIYQINFTKLFQILKHFLTKKVGNPTGRKSNSQRNFADSTQ